MFDCFHWHSIRLIDHKYLTQQTPHALRHILRPSPHCQYFIHIPVQHNGLKQSILFYIGFIPRRRSNQHGKQTHAKRPTIRLLSIEPFSTVNLRRTIRHLSNTPFVHPLRFQCGRTKINQFQLEILSEFYVHFATITTHPFHMRDQDVLQRQIQMVQRVLRMQPMNNTRHAMEYAPHTLLPICQLHVFAAQFAVAFGGKMK
mmetsp:Transcript_74071/g.118013  ORF Transcript_74071/g.118013 Transcript_74071/m.118013 type:complete len:201 (-) Transcript_74071:1002-1604(-)